MDEKIVILHGFSTAETLELMRAAKAASAAARDAAFAMTTETNLDWKVSELVEHVGEEHRYFRAKAREEAAGAGDS